VTPGASNAAYLLSSRLVATAMFLIVDRFIFVVSNSPRPDVKSKTIKPDPLSPKETSADLGR
jgi:hypothetical protein